MRHLVEFPFNPQPDIGEKLLSKLHGALAGEKQHPETTAAKSDKLASKDSKQAGFKHWKIDFSLPSNAMANGTNPLGLLDELRELGDCDITAKYQSLPSLDIIDPKALYTSWTIELRTSAPRNTIEEVFIFVMDEMTL